MRILLLTHYYAPEFGAPQRRWSALVERFLAAGHQVTVVAPVPHYPSGRPTRVQRRAHRVGRTERGRHGESILRTAYLPHHADMLTRTADHLVAAADALRRARHRFADVRDRPDLVIATAPAVPTLMVGRVLSTLWRVPLVVEMRDAWPDLVTHVGPAGALPPEAAHAPGRSLPRRALTWAGAVVKGEVHQQVTRWQLDARAVVTTTDRFAEVLRARGIRRVHVVRNGTDLAKVPLQHDRAAEAPRELRCLYLGNMGRSQGLDTVVRAAAALHREGVPLRVRMVGHGVEAEALADLARELDAPVEVLPRIEHRGVRAQYAWADTVVVSLRDWAPFAWTVPSKLYEILATGRHITALLDGEAADVVRASGAGDVLPPQDVQALTDLWRDLARHPVRTAVDTGGRDWVAAHADDDVLARRYLAILDQVQHGTVRPRLAGRGGRRAARAPR